LKYFFIQGYFGHYLANEGINTNLMGWWSVMEEFNIPNNNARWLGYIEKINEYPELRNDDTRYLNTYYASLGAKLNLEPIFYFSVLSEEALLKRVYFSDTSRNPYLFSLPHMAQTGVVDWGIWSLINRFGEEVTHGNSIGAIWKGTGINDQNNNGDALGIVYRLFYRPIHYGEKLSDFLKWVKDKYSHSNQQGLCEPLFDPTDIPMSTTLKNRVTEVCGEYHQ
jgi:hypothetical protein